MVDNTTDSTVKETIDTWYQNNMTDYTEKLEDTIWCNDRSYRVDRSTGYTYFGAHDRASTTHQPSLTCINDADKFTVDVKNGNGLLTYPVAMLTADETMLAGEVYNVANLNNYLYIRTLWWTLSPDVFVSNGDAYVLNIWSDFRLAASEVTKQSVFVRPAISLAPGTKITGGNGTMNSPFELS